MRPEGTVARVETQDRATLHIVVASVHLIDYHVTWKYKHFANPFKMSRPTIKSICLKKSRWAILLTPIWSLALSATGGEVPPVLSIQLEKAQKPGDIAFSFEKPVGYDSFIQLSDDLSQWSFASRFWPGDGDREWVAFVKENDRTFYRQAAYPVTPETWVTAAANTARAEYRIFKSEAVERPVSFHVYLPAAYSTNVEKHFPVLYWLHGSGAGIEGITALCNYFGNAMDEGKTPPMIIVFPNGLANGMWCDSKDGLTPIESIVIDDLIPFVDANFRTIASREGRIIEGFSMGGYGAGRLGLKYAALFRAFSMMGAGPLQYPDFLVNDPNLNPLPLRQMIFEKVYGSDMEYYQTQSPWRLAEQEADSLPRDLSIRILIGDEDSMLDNNRALSDYFVELGIAHQYRELPGVGHQPMLTLIAIGSENWDFYRSVFGE